METPIPSAAKANDYIRARLGKSPTIGMLTLLSEITEIGLPIRVHDQNGLKVGNAQVRREGIDLHLPEGTFTEGVFAHEAVRALLETRGWPRLFGEPVAAGTWHYLQRLIGMLDLAAGIRLQRRYELDCDTYELGMITAQWRRIVQLNRQKEELESKPMDDKDRIGYTLDVALASVDQRWRVGSTPVPFIQALAMFPDARGIYDQILQATKTGVPQTGWQARRAMKAMMDVVDGYLERTTGSRPMNAASQFVPSLHQDDALRTVSQATTIVETKLNDKGGGDFDIRIVNNRDGLGFSYQESFLAAAQAQKNLEAIGQENYATFVRAKVPNSILIWRPTGE
ncbi:MAG: hypothetical protein H7338_03210 [Candidatus Sericytochromatia bacterium]|nr:hypothetical protein [Candidatus Sericytochromatia bacterium]